MSDCFDATQMLYEYASYEIGGGRLAALFLNDSESNNGLRC